MVLGKLPVPGRPTILITVGEVPIALAVGAGGGGVLDIFTIFEILSQWAVKPKTTNQPTISLQCKQSNPNQRVNV